MSSAHELPPYTRPVGTGRRMASALLRATYFRLMVRRHNPKSRRWLRELREWEGAPIERLLDQQLQRLRATAQWACARCPHWREAARQAGFDPGGMRRAEDLSALPILSKPMLRESGTTLLPEGDAQRGWRRNSSGGSTGTPVQLWQDANYWNQSLAAQWFTEGWWGVRPGEASAWIWGADRTLSEQGRRERLGAWLRQERQFNAFAVEKEALERFLRGLAGWQPPLVAGYATALDLCARYLLEHPGIRVRPRAVRSTAEVLGAGQRERIQAAFQAPVYDQYGSREANYLATECAAHRGLHVNTWSRYIELVDGEGKPVPPGVPGRVLVTDLSNRATALLRYENGDVGVWSSGSCTCGREFPLLERILGRQSDFIHTPQGRLIHGEFFTHLFYGHPEVTMFQVVQETLVTLRVEVAMQQGELRDLALVLEPKIASAMGPEVRIEFRRVTEFDRGTSGKHRFTRSHLELPWAAPAATERTQ